MLFGTFEAKATNIPSITLRCTRCSNQSSHCVYEFPYGIGIGFPFFGKLLWSPKQYAWVCSICMNATKEVTKEQVKALKKVADTLASEANKDTPSYESGNYSSVMKALWPDKEEN